MTRNSGFPGSVPAAKPLPIVAAAFSAIAIIALLDKLIEPNISLGALYLIPLLVLSAYLTRIQLVAVCVGCAALREMFGPYVHDAEALPRTFFVLAAYIGSTLYLREVFARRQRVVEMNVRLDAEMAARRASEAQLGAILQSVPVGVLVLEADRTLRLANKEAERLFRLPAGDPAQADLSRLIPALAAYLRDGSLRQDSAVALEAPAWRLDGEPFLARVWLASFPTEAGSGCAAAFIDVSDDVREAEASGLENLIAGSRVVLGALSHEIRNVAAAVGVTARNLRASRDTRAQEDLEALRVLAEGLESLASTQLRSVHPRAEARTELRWLLQRIAVISGPELREHGATLQVEQPAQDTWVRAEHHGLMQAMLNILNNAARVRPLEAEPSTCRIRVTLADDRVRIEVCNPGGPIVDTEEMFRPFQTRSEGAGLGLYVSRTILRSFGGDLRYDTSLGRPCFVFELVSAGPPEE